MLCDARGITRRSTGEQTISPVDGAVVVNVNDDISDCGRTGTTERGTGATRQKMHLVAEVPGVGYREIVDHAGLSGDYCGVAGGISGDRQARDVRHSYCH